MMIFLGGVHGVGKTSMCTGLFESLSLRVISASAVIRAERHVPSQDSRTAVMNVGGNQELLIRGVQRLVMATPGRYLLDGHFALRTVTGEIEDISVEVFESIGVRRLICLIDNPVAIAKRLIARDGQVHDVDAITQLQDAELRSAQFISRKLALKLNIVQAFDERAFSACLAT
jgi:adenylate kinase